MSEIINPTPASVPSPSPDGTNPLQAEILRLQQQYADLKRGSDATINSLNQTLRAVTEEKEAFERLLGKASGKLTTIDQEMQKANEAREREAQRVAELEASLSSVQSQKNLLSLLATQYPSLLPLYQNGAINIAGLDDNGVKAHLDALANSITKTSETLALESLQGSTPQRPTPANNGQPTPTPQPKVTKSELYQKMETVKREKGFDSQEYRVLFDQWMDME